MSGRASVWWQQVRMTAPAKLPGLWFGLVELADGYGWHLYVSGTKTFDAEDEGGDWAAGADYAWSPEDRYLPLPEIAKLDVADGLAYAADVVRALAPWEDVAVGGVAVGYDDGDFVILYSSHA